jgi:hypothetical protein
MFHSKTKTIMKRNIISIIASVLFTVSGCTNLDIPPINIVTDNDIFASETGITSYMARLYSDVYIEAMEDNINLFTGEAIKVNYDLAGGMTNNVTGTTGEYWNYGHIRNVNYFLQEFPGYSSAFSKDKTDTWTGEAYFIRAFTYFAMVMRYGGIPIVDKVLNYPEQSIEELKAPRDKEFDCYKFVLEDLDKAIGLLPAASPAQGRVNRYIAYGLKARVALHVASIAKYGSIQLDGILGVPADQASAYYQMAWDAAKKTEEGGYILYNDGSGNLAASYTKIYLDRSSKETMFARYFVDPGSTHAYDQMVIPRQLYYGGYSSNCAPTLDLIEMFDDIDGNPFVLNSGTDNDPVYYADRMDIFEKAEPRLKGGIIFPGDMFKGEVIDVRKGIVPEGNPITDFLSTASQTETYRGMTIQGASGIGFLEATHSGFYIRKYLDPDLPRPNLTRATTPNINMRYAEMLLIRAEAGVELNSLGDASKMEDAAACIQLIRDRAGAKKRYAASDLTIDLVRKERRMELYCENKTFYDLKRWRLFDKEVANRQWRVLWPIFVWDQQKYYMKKDLYSEFTFTFNPTHYYLQIPTSEIQRNDLLIQNPGY